MSNCFYFDRFDNPQYSKVINYMKNEEYYKKWLEERDEYTNNVVNAGSNKIIVVAGPGTGKTTLFSKILEKSGKSNSLTLTFINALVDDLSLELFGLSDVKTLHGFAATVLKKEIGASVHPRLTQIIKEDAITLTGEDIDFERIFQEGCGEQNNFDFYKKRKDYYGKNYGYCDVIYALVKYFEKFPHKIPTYSQVIVDEFQDFNMTEVKLINLLASKSPILIVGDDDQSLYTDLKSADPKHIREKHGSACPEYLSLPLPFCSRSTKVIVEATNDIVMQAKNKGLLKNRIDKPYKYFPSKNKDKESLENPKIIYKQIDNDKYFGKLISNIQTEISNIALKEREIFSVLIVIPPQLKRYALPRLVKMLKKKGFRRVFHPQDSNKGTILLDGLKILLNDIESNLGWRIIAGSLLDTTDLKAVLCESSEKGIPIINCLKTNLIKGVKERLSVLRKIRDDKEISKEVLRDFLEEINLTVDQIAKDKLHEDLIDEGFIKYDTPRAIKDIPITITTVPSAKGLSGDYVFITSFDDEYYSNKGNLSDYNIFSFLVALTRATKKVYLISSKKKIPILLNLIEVERIEKS